MGGTIVTMRGDRRVLWGARRLGIEDLSISAVVQACAAKATRSRIASLLREKIAFAGLISYLFTSDTNYIFSDGIANIR
jgi:hypothetical protein